MFSQVNTDLDKSVSCRALQKETAKMSAEKVVYKYRKLPHENQILLLSSGSTE